VWRVVSDPYRLPAWWPGLERVEEASPEAWTEVLRTERGRIMRADFTRIEHEPERALAWRQEVEASPFERFIRQAVTRLALEPDETGGTRVELTATNELRGLARLGAPAFRRATRRQLDSALTNLDELTGGAT
jgi:carbon monoxide dehydrogenase subunit G